ncbi:arabinose 5-phosphate isomerase KdsD [Candidatus Phycosocius bacilliformis]|uniref:Arabinose 5-phosphate isomerase KdsD n=1 Tax=Candidatus Phycosocius bacilliformis TaxID=1445552 RepID=A0A2P2EAD2_9PROT|nr:KpsF/GutQ family sugar-phosphate isomerase [Candidatus Phycosocius bacilliformis]GBF58037.1 arabinose 5-phosphate isomerase KdsD [Candidatus Phycosocius bacilliformis]
MSLPAPIAAATRVLDVEIEGLRRLKDSVGSEFAAIVEAVSTMTGRLVCAGVGKSGHVARKIAATLASTGTPSQFIHPTEASHGDMGMIGSGDMLLILSKSGEVPELSDMIAYGKRFRIPIIAMTANAQSILGKAGDYLMLLPDAPEACGETRAPTTSTTMQIAYGDALAVALLERRGFTASDFRVYHPGGKLGAMLKSVADLMHTGEALPLVSPQTPMTEALLVMTAKRFGCTGVVDQDGRLIGIVTDGDVRRKAGADFAHLAVVDVMTANPMVVHPEALAAEALAELNQSGRSVVFAVDEQDRPSGILHLHDLLRAGVI